jgi:hypothetical protein
VKGYYKLRDEAAVRAWMKEDGIVLGRASNTDSCINDFEGIREQVRKFTGPVGLIFFLDRAKMRIVKMAVEAVFVEHQVVSSTTVGKRPSFIPVILPTSDIYGKQQRS